MLARYRALVLDELPRRAREERWVVRADHCFGRIVLDTAVAHARLSDEQLERAVEVADRIAAEGDPLLRELDARSLAWRGKPAKAPRA
jgi:hypothetical protein